MDATSSAAGSSAANGLDEGTIFSLQLSAARVFGACRAHIEVATKMATQVRACSRHRKWLKCRDFGQLPARSAAIFIAFLA
jgi:hypothetical protein